MKNDPIEKALAALDGVQPSTAAGHERLISALHSRYNFVAEKAARMISRHAAIDLAPEIEKSLTARLDQPAASDKGCTAKLAMARALVELEYDAPELYARGLEYHQIEPSWGKSIDTAAEFRATCAVGLVNGTHPEKLRLLFPLFFDGEWQARAGAARAIGAVGTEAAVLLLRFKIMSGDEIADVIFECFSALLGVEGSGAISFIDGFCDSPRDEIAESAMLALGASRRPDAMEILERRFESHRHPRRTEPLLLAIAASRTEQAKAWLEAIVERAGLDAEAARKALESCWPQA